ncbi:MAG: T9SS C-terminal target domain-containing protein [Bacteroidetes bacterium]|nr:MAG: T9SS C-terminal target domain-containing protein [Bacteroidota bacterium]
MLYPAKIFRSLLFIWLLISASIYHVVYSQTIRINEVMSSNRDIISDDDGSFEDWIEIFNFGDEPVNLEGFGLSDNYEEPFKWVMPAYELQPDEYLLIWASGKDRTTTPGSMQNGIQRLYYPGIPGNSVDDLVNHPSFPDNPASRNVVFNHFEAPTNIADNYGQHMYTWVTAPATGNYIFWIASDDNSRLYLSSDDSPDNVQLIAHVPGWTNPRQWDKYSQQQSGQVFLQQGQQYYLSALMKEGIGGDNLAVRWRLPDNTIEEPLSVSHCYIPSGRWHTNFRLSSDGEELILTAPGGQRIDSMPPVPIPTNISFGRISGGGNDWFYFENSTPEAPNPGQGLSGMAEKPAIFPSSGIYNEPVTIEIISPEDDVQIYYTTDGSFPDANNGNLYTGPFTINNTVYLRAIAVRQGSLQSEIAAATFSLAHQDVKGFSSNIPVMVIHEFNTPITPGDRTPAFMTLLSSETGERINITDTPGFDGRIKINIRGSSSQAFPKKGFGFHILEEDEGNRKVSLLGMPEEHNWVLHGPYSDKTLMRNAYSYSLSNDVGQYSPRTRFIELFMHNGSGPLREEHYHGVYVLTERIKIAPGRVEIEDLDFHHNSYPEVTGGYIFKIDRLNPGDFGFYTARGSHYVFVRPNEQDITPAQRDYLISFLDSLETVLFQGSPNNPPGDYTQFLDKRSFIDMHLLTEITKEIDGYRLSTFFYKDRNGKLHSGPLWDFNLSLGNADYLEGWLPQGWYYPLISTNQYLRGWYNRLFMDENFTEQYNRRYRNLRQTAFSNGHMLGKVLEYHSLLNEAQQRNYERWPVLGSYVWPNWFIGDTWDDEVFWMMDWIEARLEWMDSQLGEPYTMLHYWNFNDESDFLTPTYTINNANIEINEAPQSEITTGTGQDFTGINSRNGDKPGLHLRVNNPVGTEIIFHVPSTGYKDLLFSYESRRSGSGSNRQYISYTVDGTNFTAFDTIVIKEYPKLYQFDFKEINLSNNNPDFAIKITMHQESDATGGMSGNNRFDNVTLDGEALHGTNRPPIQTSWFPETMKLIENENDKIIDLNYFFKDPDGDDLEYTIATEQSYPATISSDQGEVIIQPQLRGGTQVNVTASDGVNPPLKASFYLLVYPKAADISENQSLKFDYWSPDEPAGSFPDHMLFVQSTEDDPGPGTALFHAYHIPPEDYASADESNIGFPYRNTRRTRINGLGNNGISFINTGRGRDLGAAVIAVNTKDLSQLYLNWQASTVIANSRAYGLRLQYRKGPGEQWRNWTDSEGNIVEYHRNETAGHTQDFKDISFPSDLLDIPYAQIRWLYYFTGLQLDEQSGARDMLALNRINISVTPVDFDDNSDVIGEKGLKAFPVPVTSGILNFNKNISGSVYDMTGRKLFDFINKNSIQVHHLSQGLYILQTFEGESLRFIVSNP